MREWLSGGAPPCQGGGRGFDPRLALFFIVKMEEQLSLKLKIEVLSLYEEAVAADIECNGFFM